MIVCTPISKCAKIVVHLSGFGQRKMNSHISNVVYQAPASSRCFRISTGHSEPKYARVSVSKTNSSSSLIGFQLIQGTCSGSTTPNQKGNCGLFTVRSIGSCGRPWMTSADVSLGCQSMNVRLLAPLKGKVPRIKCNMGPVSWFSRCASTGLIFALLVCNSSSEPVHAEEATSKGSKEDGCDSLSVSFSHGKKVFTDYSIIGIPGDGRCLFRSVAHGACLRSGKPAPSESVQRELADELRARVCSRNSDWVADEFIKRRAETEWFVEGDFNTYVAQMRKPHVWGGEPELFMASHVLQMPITVYMYDKDSGGLISIAEYGQEYGKENPVRVLYHGFGHYDALQIPGTRAVKSRL